MKRVIVKWPVSKLLSQFRSIGFPEYQREPTVWNLEKKQKLVDSILRGFDIASIYFYKGGESKYDCIDGRQRINAILSFVGKNDSYEPQDNAFPFKSSNEIYDDKGTYLKIDGKHYDDNEFKTWKNIFDEYELNIIEISNIERDEELNLLFLRLQLGSILNAGEKLHAMTGEMREFIFKKFGKHRFFAGVNIPYRRFAREQVAAQIALNIITRRKIGEYTRARYLDLQIFFKEYASLDKEADALCESMIRTANFLVTNTKSLNELLQNRAIIVSFFLFIHELIEKHREDTARKFPTFMREFLICLRTQVNKGIDIDRKYTELLTFQTDISQAAVEKAAIERRSEFLSRYFDYYNKTGKIIGDVN